METPVIASDDGVCYKQAALEGWVAAHGAVSPTTKEATRDKQTSYRTARTHAVQLCVIWALLQQLHTVWRMSTRRD
jgi:hypothetical protein